MISWFYVSVKKTVPLMFFGVSRDPRQQNVILKQNNSFFLKHVILLSLLMVLLHICVVFGGFIFSLGFISTYYEITIITIKYTFFQSLARFNDVTLWLESNLNKMIQREKLESLECIIYLNHLFLLVFCIVIIVIS